MKKTLTDIFDEADVQELDIVLEDKLITETIDEVSFNRIEESVLSKIGLATDLTEVKQKTVFRKKWRTVATIAACFAMLAVVGFGTYAYAKEVKEYERAVKFFDAYDLSTEGLSRGEIKAVYRDITTKAFSYSKTAEVIENSISNVSVDGFEILQDDPTPEDVESLWNYKNFNGNYWVTNSQNKGNNIYKYRSEYKPDEELGFDVHDRSYFEKYDGDTLLWSVYFTEFWINGYSEVAGGIIVYGNTPTWSSKQQDYAWMAKVDDSGNIIWTHKLENGFADEYIAAILENDDGTYAVISRGNLEFFCLSQYDVSGNKLSFKKTEVGNYGIWNATRFGDGYIVQLGSYVAGEYAKIVKVDRAGNITESFSYDGGESFSYEGEDCRYFITDMIEFDGKIYLSAYSVPVLENEEANAGGRYDIAAVLNYIFDNQMFSISDEELTKLVRDNYTAVLFVCEPTGGEPQEFYLVKGSLGGKLDISALGELLWDVESITTTYFSPYTSSFTIGGTSYVYRYTFDNGGALISQEKTGEVADYRR